MTTIFTLQDGKLVNTMVAAAVQPSTKKSRTGGLLLGAFIFRGCYDSHTGLCVHLQMLQGTDVNRATEPFDEQWWRTEPRKGQLIICKLRWEGDFINPVTVQPRISIYGHIDFHDLRYLIKRDDATIYTMQGDNIRYSWSGSKKRQRWKVEPNGVHDVVDLEEGTVLDGWYDSQSGTILALTHKPKED